MENSVIEVGFIMLHKHLYGFYIIYPFLLVMHRYGILPMFRLTDITFPILANTDNRSDISITSKSTNNRHHYAIKLLLNVFEHHP